MKTFILACLLVLTAVSSVIVISDPAAAVAKIDGMAPRGVDDPPPTVPLTPDGGHEA
jgi:hypothetical protein